MLIIYPVIYFTLQHLLLVVLDNQGSNTSYYNTTGKYEIYTDTTPLEGNSILVMLNGVTLANGGDYTNQFLTLKG
jgi:hypothetical protein